MSLEQQISKGIMEAMKAKEPVRLQTLRNIKKYIIEAKTAGTEIAELPDADVVKIIAKLAKQGSDSAEIYRQQNLRVLQSVLSSLRPAVVALIASAGLTILLKVVFNGQPMALSSVDWVGVGLFAAALTALRRLKWNPILVMVLCGAVGLVLGLLTGS